jgi:hypothetical protein
MMILATPGLARAIVRVLALTEPLFSEGFEHLCVWDECELNAQRVNHVDCEIEQSLWRRDRVLSIECTSRLIASLCFLCNRHLLGVLFLRDWAYYASFEL